MNNQSRGVVIGILVAVVVIGAFAVGSGMIDVESNDGPAEKLGESLDNAAGELKEGVEKATE